MRLLVAACIVALAGNGLAQPGHQHAPASAAQAHRALGTVKSVDAAKRTATIAHEPVLSLKWPAMTMSFKAKDKATFEQLKPGAEVNFEFEQRGKEYVITAVNPGWGSCSADCPMNKAH